MAPFRETPSALIFPLYRTLIFCSSRLSNPLISSTLQRPSAPPAACWVVRSRGGPATCLNHLEPTAKCQARPQQIQATVLLQPVTVMNHDRLQRNGLAQTPLTIHAGEPQSRYYAHTCLLFGGSLIFLNSARYADRENHAAMAPVPNGDFGRN